MPQKCAECKKTKPSSSFLQWKWYDTQSKLHYGPRMPTCRICFEALALYTLGSSRTLKLQLQRRKQERILHRASMSEAAKRRSIKGQRERANKKRNIINREKAKIRQSKEALIPSGDIIEQELLGRELARRSLIEFIKLFNPNYEAGWVHEDVCRRLKKFLDAMAKGLNPRLMLFLPPRSGKSLIASHNFPAWALGHFPEYEIIAASYGSSLPNTFSRKVRSFLRSSQYRLLFPNTKLDPTNENVEGWATTKGGGYIPAGVGGGITGKGAHIFIVDDPIKDAEEADSEALRQKTWDWWGSTAYTRLAPNAGVLVIQCLVGSTLVTMADGSQKPLRDIRVDDMIMAYKKGELVIRKVLNHTSQGVDDVLELHVKGIRTRGNKRHPFLMKRFNDTTVEKWVTLGEIQENVQEYLPGMFNIGTTWMPVLPMVDRIGVKPYNNRPRLYKLIPVRSVEPVGREEVFDMEVEDAQCYLANGLVCHNTRWHDDDLSGRMIMQMRQELREAGEIRDAHEAAGMPKEELDKRYKQMLEEIDQWEIISYPAIATNDEYLNTNGTVTDVPENKSSKFLRAKGDALHPKRFDKTRLMKIKRALQPRHWSALYQQNPIPDEGMFFTKTMLHYGPRPVFSRYPICMAWDLAVGQKQQNDFTVGAVGCLDIYDRLVVLEVLRAKMNIHQSAEAILGLYDKYNRMIQGNPVIGIEQGQLSMSMLPHLNKVMEDQRLFPSFNNTLKPISDKIHRAGPLQGRMQQGKVIFVKDEPWVEDVEHELLRFPGGVHDDIVDALAWLARMFIDIKAPERQEKNKKLKSWRSRLILPHDHDPMGA